MDRLMIDTIFRMVLVILVCGLFSCEEQKEEKEYVALYYDTKISKPLVELREYARKMALKRNQLKLAQEDPEIRDYFKKAQTLFNQKSYETSEIMFLGMAKEGYADAQNFLTLLYAPSSIWVYPRFKNEEKAQYWRKKSLDSGYVEAEYTFAQTYYVGDKLNENWGKYAEWSYIAAEQGHAKAQDTMGGLYLTAKGVEKDLIESYKWFSLAIARFVPPKKGEEISQGSQLNIALWSRDLLISREGMTPEQVKEAKRRVIEWEKSHPYAYPPINQHTDFEWKNIDLMGDINKLSEERTETKKEVSK